MRGLRTYAAKHIQKRRVFRCRYFFVLSGFLITKLLLDEQESTGTISLSRFYLRRLLRLTPALWFMIFLCVPFAIVLNLEILKPAILSVTYTMNWFLAFERSKVTWFNHTWSLACEEQFYLIWPAAFFLLFSKYLSAAKSFLITALIGLAAWRCYLVTTGAGVERLYFAFDTHADGLLVGCLLAMFPSIKLPKYAFIGAIVSLVVIGLLFSVKHAPYYYVGLPLTAFASAVFILCAFRQLPETSFLSNSVMVFIGKISYGIYLWHYPLYIAFRDHLHIPGYKVLVWALTVGLASISYFTIENFANRLRPKRNDPKPDTLAIAKPQQAGS